MTASENGGQKPPHDFSLPENTLISCQSTPEHELLIASDHPGTATSGSPVGAEASSAVQQTPPSPPALSPTQEPAGPPGLAYQMIALAQIEANTRLRAVDEGWAALLAENIVESGRLRHPIEVRPDPQTGGYRLVAGGHRLRAAELLGWPVIPAVVVEMTDDQARLAEIDENLIRHELNPLDRAVFLAERKTLYERLHPDAKRGGDRGNQHTGGRQTDSVSFSQDTAARCGLTDRTIRRAVMIAERLSVSVRARLVGSPLAQRQTELLALAKLSHEEQAACCALLLCEPPQARSVAEARRKVGGALPLSGSEISEESQQLSALLAKWRVASRPARRQFLMHLNATGQIDALLAIGPETPVPAHLRPSPITNRAQAQALIEQTLARAEHAATLPEASVNGMAPAHDTQSPNTLAPLGTLFTSSSTPDPEGDQ